MPSKRFSFKRYSLLTPLLAVIIVFALFEISVRNGSYWEITPNGPSQQFITVAEKASSQSDPIVLIMGNSITRNAIAPYELANHLGYEESDIENISNSGGYAFDMQYLYDSYFSDSPGLKTIIYGVDPRSFDGSNSRIRAQHRFRRVATWEQRLEITRFRDRFDLALGWIWRTWDARYQSYSYLSEIIETKSLDTSLPEKDSLGRWGVVSPSRLRNDESTVERVSEEQSRGYRFSEGVNVHAFENLVKAANARGIEVIPIRVPVTDLYWEGFERNGGSALEHWRETIENVTGNQITTIPVNTGKCVEYKSCFVDYGHMNEVGSREFTENLANYLIEIGNIGNN